MKFKTQILLVFLLAGCAGANYRPIIDTQGVDFNRYESDLQQCQQFSMQTGDSAQKAAVGAAAGAILGSVLAAAAGGGYNRSSTARVGAVTGAVSGGAQGEIDQRNIIRRCLSGRGYRVLQ